MSGYQNYQRSMADRITSATPEELMVMLYEGMISRTKQAKERYQTGMPLKAKESVIRAMKIADALMENVNLEQGGDTAKNLETLYHFVIAEFAKANRAEDPHPHLDNALRILEPLMDGWKKLLEKTK